jgi:hypothetical protein
LTPQQARTVRLWSGTTLERQAVAPHWHTFRRSCRIVQFCDTFSQHLQIDSVRAEEFDAALATASMCHTRAHKITHHDLLAHVHIGLLRTIKDYDVGCQEEDGSSGGGYTGDVCNEKTWTECLDHYLSRTHKMKVGAFVGANYYRLSNDERLDLLDILVHDCLDTSYQGMH